MRRPLAVTADDRLDDIPTPARHTCASPGQRQPTDQTPTPPNKIHYIDHSGR